jgi:acetolactate synthase regulatory subunit
MSAPHGVRERELVMQAFHIRYRNTQGTLMRILNAVSRRGLDVPYVQAEPTEQGHRVTVLLEVNPKQVGQLFRDWNAVVDVIDVKAGAPVKEGAIHAPAWATAPHPPANAIRAAEAAATA